MGKLVGKCMTLEDLKEASIDDLGLSCETDSPPSFSPDKAQVGSPINETLGYIRILLGTLVKVD